MMSEILGNPPLRERTGLPLPSPRLLRTALLILIGAVACIVSCHPVAREKRIHVVFRLDDFSALSSAEWELKLIEAFREEGGALTIGVIPFDHTGSGPDLSSQVTVPLTPRKAEILGSAVKDGTADIALHGYSHQELRSDPVSEFAGLPYDLQLERIAKGKEFLESLVGLSVATFVPPWNTYDRNTLRALEALGFSTLSASLPGPAIRTSRLNFLPTTCELHGLRAAVAAARRSSEARPLIVVLFHAYDFREIDATQGRITYSEFAGLLEWLRSGGDVDLLSISGALEAFDDLGVGRFMRNNAAHTVKHLLPPSVRQRQEVLYAESLTGTWIFLGLFYPGIAVLTGLVFFGLARLVFPRFPSLARVGPFAAAVLSTIVLVYAFHDLSVNIRGMTAAAGAVGATAGLWACARAVKRRAPVSTQD